jgi:hypothetical protein
MIVPSMTVQEIHKEVFDDINNLHIKLEECRLDFKKNVLKASHYPLTKSYNLKSGKKKNVFIVDLVANKRSDWKNPILSIHALYSRPEGKYAVAPTIDMGLITIYPPHFFQRVRERIIKDTSISSEDLMKLYFKNDWGFVGAVIDENYKSVYHSFETSSKDEKISFVAATSQGYCFGERQGNVNIIKTIVSEDMLFENQKLIFSKLKNDFKAMNAQRYGTPIPTKF